MAEENGREAKEEDPLMKHVSLVLGGERVKRDEWSEGAVSCLLDVYESKWTLRNRAKLKGQDWEDVARQVSSRPNCSGSRCADKTATQCKNKIESMKKRYRNETSAMATSGGTGWSRWPLFSRLDELVRCRPPLTAALLPLVVDGQARVSCDKAVAVGGDARASQSPILEPNGVEPAAHAQDQIGGDKGLPIKMEKEVVDQNTRSSNNSSEDNKQVRRKKRSRSGREDEGLQITKSIQYLAQVILRVEQGRIETIKEVEKIRSKTEAMKGEMDLKRVEVIANIQLQIAKLFLNSSRRVNSSPKIRRNT